MWSHDGKDALDVVLVVRSVRSSSMLRREGDSGCLLTHAAAHCGARRRPGGHSGAPGTHLQRTVAQFVELQYPEVLDLLAGARGRVVHCDQLRVLFFGVVCTGTGPN